MHAPHHGTRMHARRGGYLGLRGQIFAVLLELADKVLLEKWINLISLWDIEMRDFPVTAVHACVCSVMGSMEGA